MLRNDSAMNFSPEMFEEFFEPFDQRLLTHFGGGAMHSCGRVDHYIHRLSKLKDLHAFQMSQPNYNDMDVVFENTVEKDIQLIGLPQHVAKEGLNHGFNLKGNVYCR